MAENQPKITSKNLGILVDQMNAEALAFRKCAVYSEQLTDPALKDLAMNMKQHHKQSFDGLLGYLNSHQ